MYPFRRSCSRIICFSRLGLVLAMGLAFASLTNAQVFQSGGPFVLQSQNAPDNFNVSFSLSEAPQTILADGGKVILTESIHSISSSSEWLVLDVESANGGPLAGDPTQTWSYDLFYPFQQRAFVDEVAGYWSFNEQAYSPITPFGSGFFAATSPNPLNPNLGPVFDLIFTPPAGPYAPFTSRHGRVVVSPYTLLSNGGVNPSMANGFHYLVHAFTASIVTPEVSSVAALAAIVVGWGVWSAPCSRRTRPFC